MPLEPSKFGAPWPAIEDVDPQSMMPLAGWGARPAPADVNLVIEIGERKSDGRLELFLNGQPLRMASAVLVVALGRDVASTIARGVRMAVEQFVKTNPDREFITLEAGADGELFVVLSP